MSFQIDRREAWDVMNMPFLIGLLGNFSGHTLGNKRPYSERKFVRVDCDTFGQLFQRLTPGLDLRVPNVWADDGSHWNVALRFQSMEDFEPEGILRQVEPLREIMELRRRWIESPEELEGALETAPAPQAAEPNPPASRPPQPSSRSNPNQVPPVDFSSMLQAAIQATKQPEITPSDHLVQSWVQLAMQGVRSVDSQTRLSAQESVRALDARLSRQLAAIMQHPDFQRLEGAWRGFFFLVRQMEIGSASGLFVLNCSLEELAEDMLRRDTIEQSLLYRWLYSQRLEVRDEVPLGVLLADFEFGRAASDFQVLDRLSQIAAETFCPLVTSPAPELLDLSGWDQLSTIRDPFAREPSDIRSAWQAFRNCPTAWMVGWTVPRLLARLPYGADTRPIEAFEFEELDGRSSSDTKPTPSSRFCWSSSIYGYGLILAQASAGQGWCIRIEGYEAARLENLPVFVRSLDDDEFEIIGPAECSLSESLIGKVATHGFIPLANYAQRRSVAFASSCSACEVPRAGNPADDRDLMIATGMPSVFVISRLAQMLKLFVRDNLPGTMGPQELENQLVRWLQSKVSQRPTADNGQPHGRPLASAQLGIQTDPDQPHQRVAVMRLQPWLYGEQLHRPLTVMVKI